jgi:hypothetical protein
MNDIMRGYPWYLYSLPDTRCSSQSWGISLGQTFSLENNIYRKVEYTNTQQDLPIQKLNYL